MIWKAPTLSSKDAKLAMRPLVEKGRPLTYAVQGAVNVGMAYLGYQMKKEGHKMWYLPPVIMGAVHVAAGTLNIKLALRF